MRPETRLSFLVGPSHSSGCDEQMFGAQGNKSSAGREATNKRDTRPALIPLEMCPMKPTIKIRFTEPQIALVMRAHPNCNLDRLTELSFEFDQAGKIIDCIGTIKDGGNIDHDYAGGGLACLYERARRQLAARQTSATILQFPDGERLPGRPASACSRYPRQDRPGPRLPLRTGA